MNFSLIFLFALIQPYTAYSEQKDTMEVRTKEISVSALRYPEKLIEVPMAISIIYKSELETIKGLGIDEPLKAIPGVIAQTRAGAQDVRITIRGFGARGAGDKSNSGTSRGIKIITNGIPETEPDGRTSFDFLDLSLASSIEVIRSNSSAIWGNAAGGIISINTIPERDITSLNFTGIAGSFGFQKYIISGMAELGNGLFWANATASKYDGFRQNSNTEKYLLDLGFRTYLNELSTLNVFLNLVNNKFNIPGPLTQTQFDSAYTMANPYYLDRKERRDNSIARIGLNTDYYFDDNNSISGMFFLSPKYLQRSERNTYRDFTRYHLGGNSSYKNRINFSDKFYNIFLVGFDEQYQDGALLFYNLSDTQGRGDTIKDNKREGANSFGAFIQDEVIWDEKASMTLGLRYDNITYSNQNFLKLDFTDRKSFERITPKLGLSYRFDNEHTVYMNYGGGVEVPAGNETDPDINGKKIYLLNPLLEPIVSQTFEIGNKNTLWTTDGIIKLLTFDAAAYYITITNDIIPYGSGSFYMTAGKSSRLGIEAGTYLKLDYGFSFNAAFTYMNSKYDDYRIDSIHFDTSKANIITDYSGNKAAGIPDVFYNLGLRYKSDALKSAFVELNVEGIGKYFADDANQFTVSAYNIINIKAGLENPIKISDNYSIGIFASLNNIFDKKYTASAFINPDIVSGKPVYLEPGLPRNFIVGIHLGWN